MPRSSTRALYTFIKGNQLFELCVICPGDTSATRIRRGQERSRWLPAHVVHTTRVTAYKGHLQTEGTSFAFICYLFLYLRKKRQDNDNAVGVLRFTSRLLQVHRSMKHLFTRIPLLLIFIIIELLLKTTFENRDMAQSLTEKSREIS